MLGALIGDIAGSIYEWKNIKTKNFPLFRYDSRMTDESVMTAAVANAVLLTDDLGDLEGFKANVAAELRRVAGKQLNPDYVELFLQLIEEGEVDKIDKAYTTEPAVNAPEGEAQPETK